MTASELTLLQTGWGLRYRPKALLCPCRLAAGTLERTETETTMGFRKWNENEKVMRNLNEIATIGSAYRLVF